MSEKILVLDNSAIVNKSQNYWWMMYLFKKKNLNLMKY